MKIKYKAKNTRLFSFSRMVYGLLLVGVCGYLLPHNAYAQFESRRKRATSSQKPTAPAPTKNNPKNFNFIPAPNNDENYLSGIISDKITGEPIPSATVILLDPSTKQTIQGTFTDAQGRYKILVNGKKNLLLQAHYLGMQTVELSIKPQAAGTLDITLEEDAIGLEAVVVTALNVKEKKVELGYATQEIKPIDVIRSGETNIINGLSAKIAGVQTISTSGMPGASTLILIRGIQSITGNNQPLFVVDGVPFDNTTFAPANGNPLQGVALSNRAIDLNPDDIESINVLKGPAASALYGTRAGTGAIVITTKKGSFNQGIRLAFRTSAEIAQINRMIAQQQTYAQGTGGLYMPTKDNVFGSSFSWGARIDTLAGVQSYDNVNNIFGTGSTFNHSLEFTNSNENNIFHLALGRMDQVGVLPETGFARTTARAAYTSRPLKKVLLNFNLNLIQSKGKRAQQGSNLSGIMLGILRTPPSFDNAAGYQNPDGSQRSYTGAFDNPFWSLNKNPFEDNLNRVFSSNTIEYEPLHWLKLTARIGIDFYSNRQKQIFAIGTRSFSGAGFIYENEYTRLEYYNDLFATFKKKLGNNFDASLTVGGNFNDRQLNQIYAQGARLSVPDFYNISNAADITAVENKNKVRIAALFAFAKLRYKDLLILNLTARNEYASTFGTKRPSFFYPSANLGFVISELPFYQESKVRSVLSFAKARFALSIVGQEPPPYSTRTYFNNGGVGDGYVGVNFPFAGVPGVTLGNTKGNDDLKPETVTGFEIGADLRFWENRISLDITYYSQVTTQAIFTVPMSPASGYAFKINNDGRMTNKGIEIILQAIPIQTKKLKWSIEANFSHNVNKVEKLAAGIQNLNLGGFAGTAGIFVLEGQPYGVIYGTEWKRNEAGQKIIDANGYPELAPRPGILGYVLPDFLMGIRNTLTIGTSWTFSTLVDIRKGGDIFNGTLGAMTHYGTSKLTENRGQKVVFEGVVEQKDNDGTIRYVPNTKEVVLDQNWYTGRGGGFNGAVEDFTQDGSWIRLRELSIMHRFEHFKWKHLDNIELMFTGRNLLLYAPNFEGMDPETNLSGASSNAIGIEYFNFPQTRSFLLSVGFTLK